MTPAPAPSLDAAALLREVDARAAGTPPGPDPVADERVIQWLLSLAPADRPAAARGIVAGQAPLIEPDPDPAA